MTNPCTQCVPQFEVSPSTPVQCCGMGCESPRDRLIREATVAFCTGFDAKKNPGKGFQNALEIIKDHANELYPQE